MIVQLRGQFIELNPSEGVLLVNGNTAYQMAISLNAYEEFNTANSADPITVETHQIFKEDDQLLFGFACKKERELFKQLIAINGIGPKMGIAVVSSFTLEALTQIVAEDDLTTLLRVPGVGKKTGERVMVDLRNKVLPKLEKLYDSPPPDLDAQYPQVKLNQIQNEVTQALTALGYGAAAIKSALKKIDFRTYEDNVGIYVRKGLQLLTK